MANPPAHHGNTGLLYMSTSRAGAMQPVALISEWSLDMTRDMVETTSLGDTNKAYVAGLKDLKGSLSAFWTATDDTLFAASESIDGIQLGIYPAAGSPTFFAGPAWLSVSVKGGVSSAVSIDGTFTGNGAWTIPTGV